MTNREYAINLIAKEMSCNNKYLHAVLGLYRDDCSDKDKKGLNWCPWYTRKGSCSIYCNCDDCFNKWLDEEYSTPMPELKNGTFVNVYISELSSRQNGIIVDDIIFFEVSNPIRLKDNIKNIESVYNAKTFGECDAKHCIWEKE